MFVAAGTVAIDGPRAMVRIFVSARQTPNSTARAPRFAASTRTIPRSFSGSRLGAGGPSAALEAETTKQKKTTSDIRVPIMGSFSFALQWKRLHTQRGLGH